MLSLNSLGARRGLVVNFSDLQELLNGCSQLEVGYSFQMVRFHSLVCRQIGAVIWFFYYMNRGKHVGQLLVFIIVQLIN